MSQASADEDITDPEPPLPNGAKERAYIDQMANESGLSGSEFVATVISSLGAATGTILVRNPGVMLFDATLGNNLDSLLSAADYPDWDTLTVEEQNSYGNRENYDSSKFVSLMDAYDLTDGYDRFAETGSSGGGFAFTPAESARLKKIGRIGNNWINHIGNSIDSIKQTLREDYKQAVYRYLYGTSSASDEYVYKGEGNDNWEQGKEFYYKKTNQVWYNYQNYQGATTSYYYLMASNDNVLAAINYHVSELIMFSKTPFMYGVNNGSTLENISININRNATKQTDSQGRVYYIATLSANPNYLNFASQTVNNNVPMTKEDYCNILYNESSGSETPGELVPDISGYPETEVPQNTIVYYPLEGINPSTTWNQYTTVQRPDNPFNPDDQSSTPEWKQETTQNVQGLQGIHFDKLFPFSMVYSIPNLVSVVRNGVTNDSQAKNVVVVPFRWSETYVDELTLDLSDLVSLLVMVRPFNRVLLVFALLMALVLFWKSILTGD